MIIEQDIVITTFATHDDYKNSDLVSYTYFLSYTYTITFDSDGGCIDILSKEVRTNEKYGKLPLPNKDNFIFKGWFLNQQYSILITDESVLTIFPIASNTLNGIFISNQVYISMNLTIYLKDFWFDFKYLNRVGFDDFGK